MRGALLLAVHRERKVEDMVPKSSPQGSPNTETQAVIEGWREDNCNPHPHSSLGYLNPEEFITQRQGELTADKVVCSG